MIIEGNNMAVQGVKMQVNADRSNANKKDRMLSINPPDIELNMNVNEDDLKRAVERVNEDFMSENRRMEYSFHDETNRYVIKIINKETDEVIKQIPSQKLLDYASGLMEYIGLNVDSKV